MALVGNLLQKLDTSGYSPNLLHLEVQNWIVFQRNTFDYFDVDEEPFTCQVFLIETSTGRYIHRSQGQKVDLGITLDADLLVAKLIHAFQVTQPCQGYLCNHDAESQESDTTSVTISKFPYPRKISPSCQFYVETGEVKVEGHDWIRPICPPCQEAKIEDDAETSDNRHREFSVKSSAKGQERESADEALFPSLLSDGDADVLEDQDEDNSVFGFSYEPDDDPDAVLGVPSLRKRPRETHLRAILDSPSPQHKRLLPCNHCGETFSSSGAYNRHLKRKRPLTCLECDKRVGTFADLLKHVSVKHQSKRKDYLRFGQQGLEEKMMKEPKKCTLCDMTVNGNVLLFRHKEIYHELGDFKCSACQEPCLTYYDLAIHNYQRHAQPTEYLPPHNCGLDVLTHPDGRIERRRINFACQFCPATFSYDSGWTLHMRNEHNWGIFECKPCDEVCHFGKHFSAHMLNFHAENPEIKCPNCSEMFSLKDNPSNFDEHYPKCRYEDRGAILDGEHAGKMSKPQALNQCHLCGKKYVTKTSFDAHLKQHQGIERYKCTQCDYGTNHKSVLLDHERMHLRQQGLTNADTDQVLYHQCDQCGKQISKRHQLQAHIKRVHQGIKPSFPCKECGSVFSCKTSLYQHRRQEHGFVSHYKKTGRRLVKGS
ncbi:hypothetical protein TCAL_12902 [Tigriopus californicus]|uniref:C2H2-type domain-containing protein n=1 Tax=Tigriopus californicus TaxID=6832 RepID=A0A553NB89_TIGCA|nr:zinc finger protein 225-like [Tigriopus californicus]TRY62714.1 hypothetical protein TCAL_12902 [Tigriopus californicus]|eukprot:TCALIF_12902-PA protein Name:"Similar to Zfp26 Zinc finger protein 26 (Mus musculus)" AED:0.39 eAED:0.39 QI:0/-1/0/1/-1/1/1/0/652